MVFFTCSHCGDSVKKNKVEKHYQTACSRNPISVTCIDCCKDFSAETYTAHTKCVSEEEKYSAKGFQPKPSANKGEKKQLKWQEVIQAVRETHSKNLSHNERKILDILVKHENVPRKRVKFQNFLRSILKGQYNANTVDSIFDKIEAESKQDDSQNPNESKEEGDTGVEDVKENPTEQSEEKLSRKEKKEKKKKAKYEAELKEIETNQVVEEEEIESEGQIKNKSKSKVMGVNEKGISLEEENSKKNSDMMNGKTGGEEDKKSKKKKKKYAEENNMEENDVTEERPKKKKKMLAEENNTQQNGTTDEEQKKIKVENIEENGIKMDICENEEIANGRESKKSRKKHKKDVESEDKVGEKGKKKRSKEVVDEIQDEEPCKKKAKEVDPEEAIAKTGKTKFSWQDIILEVLNSKEEKELSLKRLRKKVLAEFEHLGCGSASDEKNIAKFNKKVNHTPGVVVLKDTAKLVSVQ